MKSNPHFHNPFISSYSNQKIPIYPSLINSPIKQSFCLNAPKNTIQTNCSNSRLPINFDKKVPKNQPSIRNSQLLLTQNLQKQYSVLERSKSQLMPSIYTSPFKKDYSDELNQGNGFQSSISSQITFAKPSQFLTNSQKSSFCYIQSQKIPPKNTQNFSYYGQNTNNIYSSHHFTNHDSYGYKSPSRSSVLVTFNNSPIKNSIIINKNQSIRDNNLIGNPLYQSQKRAKNTSRPTVIFKNKIADFNYGPQLKRALSNMSIMSEKGKINSSGTKVSFNYISPSKSETKSSYSKQDIKNYFFKEDIKNPLNKLLKKKQTSRKKVYQQTKTQTINEVVNQYFPQFKVKRNKMIKNVSSPTNRLSKHKKIQPNTLFQNNVQTNSINTLKKAQQNITKQASQIKSPLKITEHSQGKGQKATLSRFNVFVSNKMSKTDFQQETGKNHTLIAGLDGFSQFSETKIKQKEDSTHISHETPKNNLFKEIRNQDTVPEKSQLKEKIGRISGYRITLTGEKIPLTSINNEIFLSTQNEISQISKGSQISMGSEDLNLSRKQQNNSSKTTDYEQEMVRKLKQELGLNYSYYKK